MMTRDLAVFWLCRLIAASKISFSARVCGDIDLEKRAATFVAEASLELFKSLTGEDMCPGELYENHQDHILAIVGPQAEPSTCDHPPRPLTQGKERR